MNKELSSLNHNEPVSIYRRGEGGRERGRGGEGRGSRGIKGKQRGNQSSRTEFNGGLWKIDFQWSWGEGRNGLLEYSRTLWEGFGKFHFIILSFLGIITFLSY